MTRTTIADGLRAYTVNFDDPRRRGDMYQSLVIAQLVDELTGREVRGRVQISTNLRGSRPKSVAGGVGGLAGVPSRLFPKLDVQPYAFDLRFEAAGFVPAVLPDVTVPQLGNFPNAFADVNLGLVQLRRRPVVIAARTMQLGPGDRMEKLPLATVQVTGIWRRVADLSGAAAPPDLVAIRPALSARRPAPGTTLEPVSMPSIGGPVRRLVRAAEPGAATIEVSRTGSLGAPDVVAIDPGDPDRVEYIEVHDVTGPSDPESPATVVLAFPVQQRHREGVLAMEVAPTPIGLGTADLTAEGLPGDPTVFVATVAPFAAPAVVHITGGTAPDEYAVASTYVVDTDGEGYGRLPPLTRVAAVEVAASKTGPPALAAPPTAHTPNYGITENPLSLLLE